MKNAKINSVIIFCPTRYEQKFPISTKSVDIISNAFSTGQLHNKYCFSHHILVLMLMKPTIYHSWYFIGWMLLLMFLKCLLNRILANAWKPTPQSLLKPLQVHYVSWRGNKQSQSKILIETV